MSSTPPQPEGVEVTTVDLRRSWGFVLAVGIASVVAGLLTLIWPGVTVLALVFVLGVFLLVAGVSEVGWLSPSVTREDGRSFWRAASST